MPDEGRDKDVPRALVDGLRTRRLLDLALVHDSNAVGDRECLLLIMGNIDRRDANLFLYRADRGTHLHAQLCIEIGKRFIHEQYARMDDDGAGKCNALLLTARETFGKAILIVRDLYHVEDFIDALLHLRLWHLTQLQPIFYVLPHGEMREDRIALEHHADVALMRGNVIDSLLVEADVAALDAVESCDHAQERRLAAA